MKTKLAAASLLSIMFIAASSMAAPTGGLAKPIGAGSFAVSVSMGYLERELDGSDELDSRRLLVRAHYGILDPLDVYVGIGFADLSHDDSGFEGSLGEHAVLGCRYSLLELPENVFLVTELQGEYAKSEDGGDESTETGAHLSLYILRQFGPSGRVGYFYPFGGMRLSYVDYDNSGFDDSEADNPFGVFAGVDYFVNPNVFFSAEMHLFDESSISVSAGYRF